MKEIEIYKCLKKYKFNLTKQQYLTIKGQIKAGNCEAAFKGLTRCLKQYKKED